MGQLRGNLLPATCGRTRGSARISGHGPSARKSLFPEELAPQDAASPERAPAALPGRSLTAQPSSRHSRGGAIQRETAFPGKAAARRGRGARTGERGPHFPSGSSVPQFPQDCDLVCVVGPCHPVPSRPERRERTRRQLSRAASPVAAPQGLTHAVLLYQLQQLLLFLGTPAPLFYAEVQPPYVPGGSKNTCVFWAGTACPDVDGPQTRALCPNYSNLDPDRVGNSRLPRGEGKDASQAASVQTACPRRGFLELTKASPRQ